MALEDVEEIAVYNAARMIGIEQMLKDRPCFECEAACHKMPDAEGPICWKCSECGQTWADDAWSYWAQSFNNRGVGA